MKLINVVWFEDDGTEESQLWFHPNANVVVPDDKFYNEEYDCEKVFGRLKELGFHPVQDFVIGRSNWM